MKVKKVVSILFIVVGLLFAVLGMIEYFVVLAEKEDCIYATAYIVRIDERETGDDEIPIKYTTYVELDVNGEKITTQMNTYESSFELGDPIEIYYFENDLQMVYEEGSDVFLIVFALIGAMFAVFGAILLFKEKRFAQAGKICDADKDKYSNAEGET